MVDETNSRPREPSDSDASHQEGHASGMKDGKGLYVRLRWTTVIGAYAGRAQEREGSTYAPREPSDRDADPNESQTHLLQYGKGLYVRPLGTTTESTFAGRAQGGEGSTSKSREPCVKIRWPPRRPDPRTKGRVGDVFSPRSCHQDSSC